MKRFTKIMAVILAAALSLIMCVIPACASEMEDSAVYAESGKTCKVAYNKNTGWLKFKVSEKGTVTIKVKLECHSTDFNLFDSDGNKIWHKTNVKWDTTSHIANNEWKIELDKGTYYLGIKKYSSIESYNADGKITIKYPSDSSSSSSSSSNVTIKITMDEGDKISLGTLVSGKEKSVTWTSSKSSVAKVSSKGRVTAVKEGTATLTAKSGNTVVATVIIEVE